MCAYPRVLSTRRAAVRGIYSADGVTNDLLVIQLVLAALPNRVKIILADNGPAELRTAAHHFHTGRVGWS